MVNEVYSITKSSNKVRTKDSLLTSEIHWPHFLEHSENSIESHNLRVEEDIINDLAVNGKTVLTRLVKTQWQSLDKNS